MKKKGNKILIIVIIILSLLLITGGLFAYAYFYTDLLKSEQELFAKYLVKNLESLKQITNTSTLDRIGNTLNQNKYEATTTFNIKNDMLNGELKIESQNDKTNMKTYKDITISSDGEKLIELEYMQENDLYYLRFPDAIKQFLSIENNNLKQLAQNFGIDQEILQQVPENINFEKYSLEKILLTDEEKNIEIQKYLNLLYENIAKDKYSKNKNVVITVNGNTITTNAYILTLNSQDIKDLQIKILEQVKQDEIILNKLQNIQEQDTQENKFIKNIDDKINQLNSEEITEIKEYAIAIYEQNGEAIRIKIDEGSNSITFDTKNTEESSQIDIKSLYIDENQTQFLDTIVITKSNIENYNLNIKITSTKGKEQNTIDANIKLAENENNIKINVDFNTEQKQILFESNINIVDQINYKVQLDNSNNIILNDLQSDQLKQIIELVGSRLIEQYSGIIEKILNYIAIDPTSQIENENQKSFNEKFLVYEGDNITGSEINSLMNVVLQNNLNETDLTKKVIINGDIKLDATATEIENSADLTNTYKVKCEYNTFGYITNITITKNINIQ